MFALENQSEREFLIMLLAGLQCSKRCQFNNCFVFFCHGEESGFLSRVECRGSNVECRGSNVECRGSDVEGRG